MLESIALVMVPDIVPGTTKLNGRPLLAWLDTVTTTFPLVLPAGTGTVMPVLLQLVGLASTPLNVTVLDPCDVRKLFPVIVTTSFVWAAEGLIAVRTGGSITSNASPLLVPPTVVTVTGPSAAPAGTVDDDLGTCDTVDWVLRPAGFRVEWRQQALTVSRWRGPCNSSSCSSTTDSPTCWAPS